MSMSHRITVTNPVTFEVGIKPGVIDDSLTHVHFLHVVIEPPRWTVYLDGELFVEIGTILSMRVSLVAEACVARYSGLVSPTTSFDNWAFTPGLLNR